MKNNKERIITALILLIFVFALFSIIVSSTSEISLSARSASLYEPKTKSFIYQKNANIRLPMASTTKIMTALVALENGNTEDIITVSSKSTGIEGSSLYLKAGEKMKLGDLLYAVMLRSANDAAAAVAEGVAGSIEAFSELMNQKASELGLKNTHFTNPHGLDDPEHYTTASELAIISAEALKNSTFKEIVSSYKKIIVNTDGEERLIVNHNKLLNLYKDAIGVKTGFTKKSGRCLVGAAERNGLMLITVTIDAPSDWNDHRTLFDLGFSTLERITLASPGEFSYTLPVINGEFESITVSNTDEFSYIKRFDEVDAIPSVQLSRYLVAPIKKGDAVGKITFLKGKEVIGEINLYAEQTINTIDKKGLFSR